MVLASQHKAEVAVCGAQTRSMQLRQSYAVLDLASTVASSDMGDVDSLELTSLDIGTEHSDEDSVSDSVSDLILHSSGWGIRVKNTYLEAFLPVSHGTRRRSHSI